MKDRLILFFLILVLWIFLVVFEVYLDVIPSTLIVLVLIVLYCGILVVSQFLFKDKIAQAREKLSEIDYQPSVSVVIPAHNEELVIEETIECLVKLDYPNYKILVVDDRSKDNTAQKVQALVEKYKDRVQLHSRPDDAFPGKSAVLNDALELTDGEVLCIFDADAKVEPDFLTKIVPYLVEEKTAAVQARKVIINKYTGYLTRVQHYEYSMDSNIQMGRDSIKAAVELRGNGELIKRSAIKAVGGWNLYTLTDDLDTSTKLYVEGFNIRFCPDVVVNEEASPDFKSIVKQRKRWAEGSIRRYLDYSDRILTSKHLSKKISLDMIAYFLEFVLPVWLISDVLIQIVSMMFGRPFDFIQYIMVLAAIGLFFVSLLFLSIRKLEKYSIFESLKWSIGTAFFVIVLWTIVVILVVTKIIFSKRDMKWYKTDRVGVKI